MTFCAAFFCACSQAAPDYEHNGKVSVTVLNGEHYSVKGGNKHEIDRGGEVTFDIELERGYAIAGVFGDDKNCEYTDDISFNQTLTVSNVNYNVTVRLLTKQLSTNEFNIVYDENFGSIKLTSALGEAHKGEYYSTDIVDLTAIAKDGYRFICWSIGDYIANGGELYSYFAGFDNFDFKTYSTVYANFKSVRDMRNTIIYDFVNGSELVQDCATLIAHHPRANTMTAVELREQGVDCDSKLLAGWLSEDGDYVGLGSRVAVNDERYIKLDAIWKNYASVNDFAVDESGNRITEFKGVPDKNGEVVVPREINGKTISSIASEAFKGCGLSALYLPDSIETIEDNAFLDCIYLTEIYMSDNIVNITDAAFKGCKNLTTLHLNAFHKPRFNYQEIGQKTDLYDLLEKNADNGKRKIVVLGGSSVRYGYSTYKIREMFSEVYDGEFDVYNMGWNAGFCSLAQFEVINKSLREGDVFIHAPELYGGQLLGDVAVSPLTGEQAAVLTGDYSLIYRIVETNYDFLSYLTVSNYANVFSMLATFNKNRLIPPYPPREYTEYFKGFVDDDSFGIRSTTEMVEAEGGENKAYSGKSSFENLDYYKDCWNRLNAYIYSRIADGVNVFVAFSPINVCNLELTYDTTDSMIAAADNYTQLVKTVLADSNVTLIGEQKDSIYAGEHFVGHDFHLGAPFRDTHTENIISKLIQALRDSSLL
ncbi:MAG: leucine-rich repeat domain-containing protein [Clostridiales bacterium]|nr:leucine-rich repeat domain-containing protein [Clostridiales bacterium]